MAVMLPLHIVTVGATPLDIGDVEGSAIAGAFAVLARGAQLGATVQRYLVPFARARAAARGTVEMRTLRTVGVSIAEIEERLADWLGKEDDVTVSVIPAEGEAWVRLRARRGASGEPADALATVEARVRAALGD